MHKVKNTGLPIWKVVPVKLSALKSRSKWTQQLNLSLSYLSPPSQTNQAKKKECLTYCLIHFLPPNFFTSSSQIYSPRRPSFPRVSRDQSVLLMKKHQYWEEEWFLPMGTLWSLTPRESAECFIGNKLCLGYEGEQQRKCCWAGSGICWALINAKASYIH